jgi:hypothetical protein
MEAARRTPKAPRDVKEKPMTPYLTLAVCLSLLAVTYGEKPGEGHGHSAHPAGPQAELQLDNDAVQVLRIHFGPREAIPMHEVATPRLVVWLTDAHMRYAFEDGTVREERRRAGQVDWVLPQRHAGENLDDHAVEFVAIVPKPANDSRATK